MPRHQAPVTIVLPFDKKVTRLVVKGPYFPADRCGEHVLADLNRMVCECRGDIKIMLAFCSTTEKAPAARGRLLSRVALERHARLLQKPLGGFRYARCHSG
jgi:hypothetical protein